MFSICKLIHIGKKTGAWPSLITINILMIFIITINMMIMIIINIMLIITTRMVMKAGEEGSRYRRCCIQNPLHVSP